MPPGTTCSLTSKDTTIVSGFIPLSGISPPNRQSAKPLNPMSTKSGEGQTVVRMAGFVDAVFVNDDRADKAAELDQRMPVAAVARQAGGLDREDRSGAPRRLPPEGARSQAG